VLWLDGTHHRFVEEVGAMNVMFVYEDKVITPKLSGSILPGVTRDSILKLGQVLGLAISEEQIACDTILADARSGKLREMFGCGTAAAVTPVDALIADGETVPISGRQIGETTMRIKNRLLDIQHGAVEDPFKWRLEV
jgi:branched-chain amino acid aminotransferase